MSTARNDHEDSQEITTTKREWIAPAVERHDVQADVKGRGPLRGDGNSRSSPLS